MSVLFGHGRGPWLAGLLIAPLALADQTPQQLPLHQDWSEVSLISFPNDWSAVPGFVGYRGDDLTIAIGADPQTIVADGTSTPVNVLPNQTNPITQPTGGIGEFDTLSDPVVALQASGTADAPFLLLNLDTTGSRKVVVSYRLRDIDGAVDNAVQPVALQYRVGNVGNFRNMPEAFVADASTGPSQATNSVTINVSLPAETANQPLVQIRWITANALGNDEWIGIDDISVFAGTFSFVNIGQNPTGSLRENGGGSFRVIGGGNDAWDNLDESSFAYREVSGDFDAKVRVEDLQPNARWSKAGLMLRESVAEDSRMAFERVTPADVPTSSGGNGANDVRFAYRTGTFEPEGPNNAHNGGRHEDGFGSPNYPTAWLRLQRIGSVIYGYSSFDGFNWDQQGSQDTATWEGGALKQTLLVGLAVSRHSGGLSATTEFRDFELQQPFVAGDASNRGNPNGVRVTFTQPVGFGADNPGNYSLRDNLFNTIQIVSATPGPTPETVMLQTGSTLLQGRTNTLSVFGGIYSRDGIPLQGSAQLVFAHGAGYEQGNLRIARNMISGPRVGGFLGSTAYRLDLPVRSQGIPAVTTSTFFEDNTLNDSLHENFSVRISGLIRITIARNYRFACASDDRGILYLSTDDNPANRREIAREPEWSDFRAFGSTDRRNPTNPENQSAPIFLNPGNYYLEYVCAEGDSGNHASVTWDGGLGAAFTNNQIPLRNTQLFPGRMFQGTVFYTLGQVFITRQPSNQVVNAGETATFSVKVDGTPPYTFQWYSNGVPILFATGQTYTTPPLRPGDNGSSYYVRINNEFSTNQSGPAALTVNREAIPPTIVSLGALDPQTVGICFSERITPETAQDRLRYTLQGGTLPITSVRLRPDGKSAVLTVAGLNLPPGALFSLAVSNLADYSTNFANATTSGPMLRLQASEIADTPPGSSFTCGNDQIEILAGGSDVWDTSDQCHFLFKPVTNDFDVKVRLESLTPTHFWSKAGLMARETLAPNTRTIHTYSTPQTGANEIESGVRRSIGATTDNFGIGSRPSATFPNTWLRLVRVGNTFSAYHGSDGVNWILHAQTTEPGFPPIVNVGIFATSHDPTATTTAIFSGLRFQGAPTITLQPLDLTVPDCAPATFNVAASGSDLNYQWRFNGTNLPGQIQPGLTIPGAGLANAGNYTVVVSNSSGSETSTVARLTVTNLRPTVTAPAGITVFTDPGACSASGVNLGQPSTSDECGPLPVTNDAPPIFPLGTRIVTYTVTDRNGLSATAPQTVIVKDPQPPALIAPPNQAVQCAGPSGTPVSFTATATDNCGNPLITYSHQPGSSFPLGVTTVTVTATDTSSNSTTRSFTVTVRDTNGPTVIVPANQIVECAGSSGTPVNFAATATDICAGNLPLTYSHLPGSRFPLGTTTVTVTGTDPSSNSTTRSFTITVQDTTAPAPDSCLGPTLPPIQRGGPSNTAVMPATPSQALIQATGIQPPTFYNDPNPRPFIETITPLPPCLTTPIFTLGVIARPAQPRTTIVLATAQGNTLNPHWTGYLGQPGPKGEPPLNRAPWVSGAQEQITLNLARLPLANGATFDLIPVLAQNSFLDIYITEGAAVDFLELLPNSCRSREDIEVVNDPGQPGAIVNFSPPTFTDNCDGSLVGVAIPTPGSFFPLGRTTVLVTAIDHAGNKSRSWFDIFCRDPVPPTVQCQPVEVECAKPSGATVFYKVEAQDNSGHVTVQCMPPSGSMFPLGTSPVLCVATDGSGNTAECRFTVGVTGRLPPSVTPPSIRTVSFDRGDFVLTFHSQADMKYQVEFKNDLREPAWQLLREVTGDGGVKTVTTAMTGQPSRFYRLKLHPTSGEPTPGHVVNIYEPPEPPPGQPGPSDPCRPGLCGPPYVYLFSGEFHYEQVDLCIKGRGLDFVWARKYRSCICWYTAMGYAWDYSYNICIVPNGPNIDVLDGNTREDTYFQQADGSFAADQFFREGRFQPDGRFVLTFADKGTWQFLPLNGTPTQGRIERITDRNGNALRFNYDLLGRLTNVIDTLDRNIAVSYDPDGFISAVTDFTGRQVRYTHYQDSDEAGTFGDLASVTWPRVIGTPNGNNFPGGKTNIYTYSKGYSDGELNHNLLTITDGKGQTWLQNTYGTQPEFYCDQVIRQVWGYTNETLNYSYHRQTPTAANNYAVVKAIVNDRLGNVTECYFDVDNRPVLNRAYTGRAIAGVHTTETANRPSGKLRASDPDFFETRFEWNVDSMPVRTWYPNGNYTENVYELELNPAAPRRSRGNLRICRKFPGTPGGDQSALVESFDYDAGLGGGCCDFNFVSRHTDARGNVTLHFYDTRGNRIHTQHRIPAAVEDFEYNAYGQRTAHRLPDNGTGHRRLDVFSYYGAGPQRGYLAQQIVDATGSALTTTFEYDRVGNVLRAVDPRGNDTFYIVNALNQIVREISREITSGTGIRYQRDFFYDANDNVIRVDVQNRDDQGVLQDNTHQSTIFDYEILNHVVRVAQEKGSAHPLHGVLTYEDIEFALRPQFLTTEYRYDANRNRTLVRHGEATAGYDVFNTVASSYDERDLLFRETRAPGSVLQSTSQRDYDGNRNLVAYRNPLDWEWSVTRYSYDGYNRQISVMDAMGNVTTWRYDANNNCVRVRVDGELVDVDGGGGNRRLAETLFVYDEMDRRVREDKAFFDPRTQAAFGDGFSTTLTFYNPNSQVVRVTDDRSNSTLTSYDTVNRRMSVADAKMNSVSYSYDANGNVVATTEIERSDVGNPPQTFTSTSKYDGLDRLTQAVDSGGSTNRYAYDSRNNRVMSVDGRGNLTRYYYDGLNRPTETRRALTDTGNGSGVVTDTIITRQLWDDSCRLIAQTDDNGYTTGYAYDSLDRRIVTRMADGTMHLIGRGSVNWASGQDRPALSESFINGYDQHDNATLTSDANGTVVTTTFDLLHRPINTSIVPGAGILGPSFESRQFNGMSQVVLARNNDTLVTHAYDSLCHLIRETLNFDAPVFPPWKEYVTTWTWDGAGNQLSCTYPGGRLVARTYDALNRVARVCNGACVTPPPAPPATGSTIAEYYYVGPNRVERLCYGNGTCGQFGYNSGRSPTGTLHSVTASGLVLDRRTFAWDAAGNKTRRTDVRAGGPGLDYIHLYDSVDRLVGTFVSSPSNPSVRNSVYTLDGAGNRRNVTSDPAPGNYLLSTTLPEPADAQVNRYTSTPFDTGRQYDANGNVASIAGGPSAETYQYDHRNRLTRAAIGVFTPVLYTYDALGRRVQKTTASATRFFYDGERPLEEQDAFGLTLATFVTGRDNAELLTMRRGGDFYYHSDDRHTVTALSDASRNVVERYDYGDYGEPFLVVDNPAVDNPHLFAGMRWDSETALYYDPGAARYLDPFLGRFTTRHPAGVWNASANLGNAYTYQGNNPVSPFDPQTVGFVPGCGDWTTTDYCTRLAGLWGERYFCWLKRCQTGCASYACCQRPARACQPAICGSKTQPFARCVTVTQNGERH